MAKHRIILAADSNEEDVNDALTNFVARILTMEVWPLNVFTEGSDIVQQFDVNVDDVMDSVSVAMAMLEKQKAPRLQ
jgi:hypothetical protein